LFVLVTSLAPMMSFASQTNCLAWIRESSEANDVTKIHK
jgi:hypothetical protein